MSKLTPEQRQARKADKRQRQLVAGMLQSDVAHARHVRAAVELAAARGERDDETAASMIRSIDRKIQRWQVQLHRLDRRF